MGRKHAFLVAICRDMIGIFCWRDKDGPRCFLFSHRDSLLLLHARALLSCSQKQKDYRCHQFGYQGSLLPWRLPKETYLIILHRPSPILPSKTPLSAIERERDYLSSFSYSLLYSLLHGCPLRIRAWREGRGCLLRRQHDPVGAMGAIIGSVSGGARNATAEAKLLRLAKLLNGDMAE